MDLKKRIEILLELSEKWEKESRDKITEMEYPRKEYYRGRADAEQSYTFLLRRALEGES